MREVGGKPTCVLCGVCVVRTTKGVKQHAKSRAHKQFADPAAPPPSGAPAARARRAPDDGDDGDDGDDTASELVELLGAAATRDEAIRARLPVYAANLDAFRTLEIGRGARAALLPPVAHNPRRECGGLDAPFLTPQVGCIPTVPECLADALGAYFVARRDRHPKVDVGEANLPVASWAEARRALEAAQAAGRTFWCTLFCAQMGHPAWWPKAAKGTHGVGEGDKSVPFFDQIIIGSGRAGIGLHADSYGARRAPVSTCLTLARGRKRIIMLPPSAGDGNITCGWFNGEPFPLEPSAELLARIAAVGGYCFEMSVPRGGSPVAFFTPAGWFHWLLGDTCHAPGCAEPVRACTDACGNWHVAFGGSFFPTTAARLAALSGRADVAPSPAGELVACAGALTQLSVSEEH
ncbi:hypothetical protein KFE25_009353 [Diacronema lutheri]|uniref:Uncharacterized protein n=2 Tax=Diacronema lutheri TaxID=2081491 RepID=A0A8J6CDF2_DIALT|nr:hypothetical protein KFE25_009353 [Diacronema lutheri]